MINKLTGVLGTRRCGKSTLVRWMIRRLDRVVVFDPQRDHSGAGAVFYNADSAAEYLEGRVEKTFRVILQSTAEEDFIAMTQIMEVLGTPERKTTCVIEEIQKWCNPNWLQEDLDQLVNLSGNWNVDIIYTSKAFATVSRFLTSQTDFYFLFHMREPIYLKALRDRTSEEIANRIAALPRFQFIGWSPTDGEQGERDTGALTNDSAISREQWKIREEGRTEEAAHRVLGKGKA